MTSLTFLFLKGTDYDIFVVFQNDKLMATDEERNSRSGGYAAVMRRNVAASALLF